MTPVHCSRAPASTWPPAATTTPTSSQLADNLFGTHVFAFEFTGVLLIVAVAGTVLLTRRDRRPKDDRDERGEP